MDGKGSPGPDRIFHQLELQISQLETYIQNLVKLGQFMQENFFDDEDKKMVIYKINETQQVKEGLEKTLAHKQDIYNNQVKVMEHQLTSRQQALEHFDKETQLFSSFPDILSYFVSKQTRLQNTLNGIKRKLKE
jgi:hypothetical protein